MNISLLSNFKSIVELVIKFPGDSLTLQYGAIERIRSAIFSILSHGFKQTNDNLYDNFWQFILRLNANSQKYIHLLQDIYQEDNLRYTVEQWIDQSVITECFAEQLSSIENDSDLLETYYQSDAFIRMPPFYQAFVICIRTIESSDPSLLASIDPKLSIIGLEHPIPVINEPIGRSYSSTIPSTLSDITNRSSDDDQEKLYPSDQQGDVRRRIHSDPIRHLDTKPCDASDLSSSSYLITDLQLNPEENLSYSIEYGSSYDSHADSYLSIEPATSNESSPQFITNEIKPMYTSDTSINLLSARLPHSSLLWPRNGQTLDNYIREYDSQTRTDVEKDNAHFYLSEAVLSAIEYIKFSEQCRKYFDSMENIPINTSLNAFEGTSNYSNDLSAERIALIIMEKWKNYKIPTASDLFWMIPHEELEASEEVISVLESTTFDRNDDSTIMEGNERILRRGNSQWAPPREQLIFHIHQPVSRDTQLKKQSDRCPGCGREVEKGYPHRFRYCEYTGKYFCRSCHLDKKFYLPSYIINKWDFSNKHSVSNFAYDYLNRIFLEPIFNLNDLNPKLFERSSKLRMINELRWSLYSLRLYIFACRLAEENGYKQFLLNVPSYVYEQPHVYSLQDLVKTKLRELHKIYEPIVANLRDHVLTCSLCYARGFICEICNNTSNIIFPFDIQTTSVCPTCQSCFHIQCHKNYKYACPKCQRTKHRSTLSSTSSHRFYT